MQARYRNTIKLASYMLSVIIFCRLSYAQRHGCVPAKNVTCASICVCQMCDSPYPIKRLWVDCGFKKLTSVPAKIPQETWSLDLSNNRIGKLDASVFSHLTNLTRLDLSYNLLDYNGMDSRTFEGLGNMDYLILKYNRAISTIKSEWFRPMYSLSSIDLQRANVKTISEDAFKYNIKLRFVRLMENLINKIEPALFRNLPSLEKVLLQRNQLKYLPPDMFNGSVNTDELNVYNNKLTTISSTTGLQNMEKLKRLSVYQNPLDCGCDLVWFRQWIGTSGVIVKPENTTCASGVNLMKFNPEDLQCEFPVVMVTVSRLLLDFCSYVSAEERPFAVAVHNTLHDKMSAIKSNAALVCLIAIGFYTMYVYAGSCVPATNVSCPSVCICEYCDLPWPIKRLRVSCDSKKLNSVPQDIPLEAVSLNLAKNNIGLLRRPGELSYLKHLYRLDLSYNQLDSNNIHPKTFDGLVELNNLILKFNRALKTIPNEWFRTLKNLWKVDLERAHVETISEDAFRFNTKLRFIVLRDNLIKNIEPGLFRNLPSLEKVLLQTNQLKNLPPDMLNGSIKANELNVYSNKLSTITPMAGLQNMENLKRLSVYHNPLDCGCDLVWFRQWIDTNDVIVKAQNTTCASGLNLMKFNPDDLQCDFPVVMVTVLVCLCIILLCAVIALLVSNRWRIRYRLYLLKLLCKGYIPIGRQEDPVGEYKYDIFISHSSKDENWVLNVLRPTLENPPYNYKLCLDFRDFIVGSCISENIIDAINESRKTAFVVTNEFIESEWCYFELEMVRQKMFEEHRDIAILILKEDVPANRMPGLLQYLMRRGNHIEWSDNRQGQKLFWKKMENSVKNTAINMA
ncbi:toll-like receptor 13 [Ptychodera flava]|uniref:toll-like receptor 13 n=1 Tax=Ptychodera flava TaxID=63121 RepID=UPI00396A44D7